MNEENGVYSNDFLRVDRIIQTIQHLEDHHRITKEKDYCLLMHSSEIHILVIPEVENIVLSHFDQYGIASVNYAVK